MSSAPDGRGPSPEVEKTILWAENADSLLPEGPTTGGEVRLGHYLLRERLGSGAMGVVYRAQDTHLRREVALKVIRAHPQVAEDRIRRFLREAKAVASLRHANIVAVHHVGQEGDCYFFSMDLVEGTTLREAIDRRRIGPGRALEIARKLTAAIAYVHERGIVHRDISPRNILLDERLEPLLLDFGVASAIQDSDISAVTRSLAVGTPAYMPPERFPSPTGDRLTGIDPNDPRGDIYSLGAVLYEMLTGRPPHRIDPGSDLFTFIARMQSEPIRPPREFDPRIEVEVEAVVLKALASEPDWRYQSAEEFLDDLGRAMRHEPVAARPRGVFERLRHRLVAGRRRAFVGGGLVVGAALGGWWLDHSARADLIEARAVAAEADSLAVEASDPLDLEAAAARYRTAIASARQADAPWSPRADEARSEIARLEGLAADLEAEADEARRAERARAAAPFEAIEAFLEDGDLESADDALADLRERIRPGEAGGWQRSRLEALEARRARIERQGRRARLLQELATVEADLDSGLAIAALVRLGDQAARWAFDDEVAGRAAGLRERARRELLDGELAGARHAIARAEIQLRDLDWPRASTSLAQAEAVLERLPTTVGDASIDDALRRIEARGLALRVRLDEIEAEAESRIAEARRLEEQEGDLPAAHLAYRAILENRRLAWTAAAGAITLPVRIESSPPGARVLDGRREVGRTPCLVRIGPAAPGRTLWIEVSGFVRQSITIEPTGPPTHHLRLERAVDWAVTIGGRIEGPPRIAGDRILVAARDGSLTALDFEGQILWTHQPAGLGEIAATPTVVDAEGLVVYGVVNVGAVHAVDLVTGAIRWTCSLGGWVAHPTTLDPTGRIVVHSDDGQVSALSAVDGAIAWQRSLGRPAGGPAADGRGTVAVLDTEVVALDPSGRILWRRDLEGRPVAGAALVEGVVLVAHAGLRATVLDRATGEPRSSIALPREALTRPVVRDRLVHLLTRGGTWVAIDPLEGRTAWQLQTGLAEPHDPALAADRAAVVGRDGRLVVLDLEGRRVLWRHALDRPATAPPAFAGRRILVATNDRRLAALALTSGD